jgi:hypothetical protein
LRTGSTDYLGGNRIVHDGLVGVKESYVHLRKDYIEVTACLRKRAHDGPVVDDLAV